MGLLSGVKHEIQRIKFAVAVHSENSAVQFKKTFKVPFKVRQGSFAAFLRTLYHRRRVLLGPSGKVSASEREANP